MFNANKFRAKLAENGIGVLEMAKRLGKERTWLYRKMNKSDFKVSDIENIKRELKLTNGEILAIFFADSVA